MRRYGLWMACCTAALLGGCLAPRPVQQPHSGSSTTIMVAASSSAVSSVSTQKRPVASGSGIVLSQRLLSGGILEYGSPSAPHVLLAVINHASSYSKSFILEQLPRLTEEFVKDGSLRIQLLSLPIRKYAQSNKHASAIICAGMQHQGIAMSAAIAASDVIPATNAALKALGIDMKSYLACLAGKDVKRIMEEQAQALEQADVQLAPTFLLDGERFQGLQTYPDLRGRIERLLETE